MFKLKPRTDNRHLQTKIKLNPRKFWTDRVALGSLSSYSIGWEALSELEKLNKISFVIYRLGKQTHNSRKYCLQLVHHSRSDYEKVPLLLLHDEHICLIKDLKQFYRNFSHRHDPITNMCLRCLTVFKTDEDCRNHTKSCNAQTTIEYAKPGDRVGFKKVYALYPQPYCVFLDFEYLNKVIDRSNAPQQDQHHHRQIATQHPFAYKYVIVKVIDKDNPTVVKERTYFGDDCVNDMLTNLTNNWNDIAVNLKFPINFSDEDQQTHNRKSTCDIYQCKFNKTNRKKMRHHFHYLQFDNYAGTLCAPCNLQLKTPISFLLLFIILVMICPSY